MNLYPTILTEFIAEAKEQLELVAPYPQIETVQIDVIDGIFTDNITITPLDLAMADLDFGSKQLDFHFVTEEPLDYVYECIDCAQRLPIRGIIAQVEKMSAQADYLETVRKYGWQTGLSLELFTPLSAIDEASWENLDIIQLMAVETGWQGQPFHPQVIEKLHQLHDFLVKRQLTPEIIIDGAITPHNAHLVLDAGAAGLAVGSALWQSDDLDQTITDFFQL